MDTYLPRRNTLSKDMRVASWYHAVLNSLKMTEAALPGRQKVTVWNVITVTHVHRNQAERHATVAKNTLHSREMHDCRQHRQLINICIWQVWQHYNIRCSTKPIAMQKDKMFICFNNALLLEIQYYIWIQVMHWRPQHVSRNVQISSISFFEIAKRGSYNQTPHYSWHPIFYTIQTHVSSHTHSLMKQSGQSPIMPVNRNRPSH